MKMANREITKVPVIKSLSGQGTILCNDLEDVKQITKDDLMAQLGQASNISFDGTSAQMKSDNVQGAITEENSRAKTAEQSLGDRITQIGTVYKPKGTIATYADLPTDAEVGWVYNVTNDETTGKTNVNYAKTDTGWDDIGGTYDMTFYYTKLQTDSALSLKANSSDLSAEVTRAKSVENATNTELAKLMFSNAGSHNAVFRGKYLGTAVTTAQFNAISAGTFDDLYVGDYWTIGGVNYRIAGFDIFLNQGDTQLTKHHAVIVPDSTLYNAVMNDTNTATGGYYNSKMKQSGLASALSTVQSAFGSSHIVTIRALLDNAISGNDSSGWAWYDSQIDLMTDEQVYGVSAWGASAHNAYHIGCDYSRFPLFTLAPQFSFYRNMWYWLRTVYSSSGFCVVSNGGFVDLNGASASGGVRPAFLID
jgi:hypothetical protein